MLEIDRLALVLPASFGPRAARIARLAAQALAAQDVCGAIPGTGAGDRHLAGLRTAPLRVDATRSDHHIARQIAGHVAEAVRAGAAATPDGSP